MKARTIFLKLGIILSVMIVGYVILGLVVHVLGLSFKGFIFGEYDRSSAPSDEALIQIFTENQAVFERLKNKIIVDGHEVVSYDPRWSKPEDIPSEKLKEYYSLLKSIKATQIRNHGGGIEIVAWSIGLATGGDAKGLHFKPTDERYKNRDSLNDFSQEQGEFFYKRAIGDGWYLYYERYL